MVTQRALGRDPIIEIEARLTSSLQESVVRRHGDLSV
jgi:hypothetical protein